jgi:hypothetical protein
MTMWSGDSFPMGNQIGFRIGLLFPSFLSLLSSDAGFAASAMTI